MIDSPHSAEDNDIGSRGEPEFCFEEFKELYDLLDQMELRDNGGTRAQF